MFSIHDFSVLLSVYKKEKPSFFQQCLDSIFSQTLLPNEIVLVKDGPLTIELEQIIEEYKLKYSILKVIPLSLNQGLGRALNEGVKYCSFELIARMDTDDIAKPNRFEKQIAIFEKMPEIDVVGAWVDEFEDNYNNVISTRRLPEFHKDIYQFAQMRNPINHPVVMFKKNAVLAAGGYQHFPLLEDYYLWVRMLKGGAKFYNIQESLLFFRFSASMLKRRGGWRYAINEMKFQYKMWKLNFISSGVLLKNMATHFIIRLLPNFLRIAFYRKFLRQ